MSLALSVRLPLGFLMRVNSFYSLFVFFINPLFYIHLYFLYTLLIMILYFSTFSYHTAFVISCTPLVHVCVFPFLFHFFSFHLYSPRFFSPINISFPLSSPTPAIPSSTPLFFIYLSFSLFFLLALSFPLPPLTRFLSTPFSKNSEEKKRRRRREGRRKNKTKNNNKK